MLVEDANIFPQQDTGVYPAPGSPQGTRHAESLHPRDWAGRRPPRYTYPMRRPLFGATLAVLVLAGSGYPRLSVASDRHPRKYKPLPPMAEIFVTVLRAHDGKPLQHAAVVFHATSDGKDQGNLELKTNEQGQADMRLIPVGSHVLVQVIAPGYRTYGKEYDLPAKQKSITIKMLRPGEQYSIYANNHPSNDLQTNTPHSEMGHAAPADSPLLAPAPKKH